MSFKQHYFLLTGQNLYFTTASELNVSSALQAYFDEKSHYDYDTLACESGEMCGHYTQVFIFTINKHNYMLIL